jgi:hypothetical protein
LRKKVSQDHKTSTGTHTDTTQTKTRWRCLQKQVLDEMLATESIVVSDEVVVGFVVNSDIRITPGKTTTDAAAVAVTTTTMTATTTTAATTATTVAAAAANITVLRLRLFLVHHQLHENSIEVQLYLWCGCLVRSVYSMVFVVPVAREVSW